MRVRMSWLVFVGVFGLTVFPWPALAAVADSWKADWEQTLAAARKEGELSLWGDMEITHPEVVAAFSKAYPFIKVITVTGKVVELMPRIIAERRAEKYLTDIYSGGLGGRAFLDFHRAKMLDPIKPILILPDVVDESKWLGGKHHYADAEGQYIFMYEANPPGTGVSYNTKLVNPRELSSYWDLLAPQWKGKIGSYDPGGPSGSASMITFYYNPQLGASFLRRLLGEMEILVSRDRRQATDWLGSGKVALCIPCRDIESAKKKGLPVDEFERSNFKEAGGDIGTTGNSGLAMINKAPHPNSAKLFINWFLSREGQIVWQKVMNTKVVEASNSTRIDIPKDDVLPEARREEGRNYRVTGFLDPDPVLKVVNELLSEKIK